jgi:hypothetical protein
MVILGANSDIKINSILSTKSGDRFQVSTLAEVGGNDCKSSTRFMMKKLIKHEVAAQFSWIGQKGKMKFSDLQFPSVVFSKIIQDFVN